MLLYAASRLGWILTRTTDGVNPRVFSWQKMKIDRSRAYYYPLAGALQDRFQMSRLKYKIEAS
jgi:hypothetical protein